MNDDYHVCGQCYALVLDMFWSEHDDWHDRQDQLMWRIAEGKTH